MPPEYQAQLATITQDSIQRGVHGMAMNTVGLTDWLLQGSERFDTVQVHRFVHTSGLLQILHIFDFQTTNVQIDRLLLRPLCPTVTASRFPPL